MSITVCANRLLSISVLAILTLTLSGCATAPGQLAPDPLEPVNRVTSTMNKVMQDVVLIPAAKAYTAVTPTPVQHSVDNFFSNLGEPIVVLNDVLQGKFSQSLSDTGRFLLNSTVGMFGLFDPATQLGLQYHDEDFGQTLAVWGVPSGPYLVLPLLGPSTFRAGIGRYGDSLANPLSLYEIDDVAARNKVLALEALNTGSQLLDLQKQIQGAYDPYVFIRDAWLQHRQFLIYDGHPPPPQYPSLPPLDPDGDQ